MITLTVSAGLLQLQGLALCMSALYACPYFMHVRTKAKNGGAANVAAVGAGHVPARKNSPILKFGMKMNLIFNFSFADFCRDSAEFKQA